jgi:hypothetical protein
MDRAAKPTAKLRLAAICMLFDWLVVGKVLAVNQRTQCASARSDRCDDLCFARVGATATAR